MMKSAIDADALMRQFSEATAQHSGAVSQAVQEATLKALADLEKMEDTFFAAIGEAVGNAGGLQTPWAQALQGFRQDGSTALASGVLIGMSSAMAAAPAPAKAARAKS